MSLFSAFIATLRADFWPEGEASNLRTAHTGYIKAAMTDLQKWIPDLAVQNVSQYARCDRFWEDAKSVIEVPNGVIKRVYTIVNEDWRDKVFYQSATFLEVERIAKRLYEAETPENVGYPALTRGFLYEESAVDSVIGRSRVGSWAVHMRKLYVAPWLQSNEILVIEWQGVKSTWADADVVDDDLWTVDVQEAIKYYVLWQHELSFGDPGLARNWMQMYGERRGDLMVTFRERTKQQEYQSIPEAVTMLSNEEADDDDEAADDADVICPDLPDELPGDEGPTGVAITSGTGSPEGVVALGVGSIYTDVTDPDYPVQWNKTSGGYTSTGWVQVVAT